MCGSAFPPGGTTTRLSERPRACVVFPETPWKFYIDASEDVRLSRRHAQGETDSPLTRDKQDSSRKTAPLKVAEDALVIDVKRRDPEGFDFDVKRCRYAEMYREMGLGEIGHLLSCNRDGAFCQGYD